MARKKQIGLMVLVIGLGLGPLTVGIVSDLFAPTMGVDSLRYGILAMVPVSVWGLAHYLRVGQLLSRQPATGSTAAAVADPEPG